MLSRTLLISWLLQRFCPRFTADLPAAENPHPAGVVDRTATRVKAVIRRRQKKWGLSAGVWQNVTMGFKALWLRDTPITSQTDLADYCPDAAMT